MRDIKFRGKFVYANTQSGQLDWVYGDLVHGPEKHTIISEDGIQYEVLSSTVGQFTGVYDKNGKEVYEGDIVSLSILEYEERFQIAFIEGAFCLVYSGGYGWCDIHLAKECTIVGNKYDNPKLLKNEFVRRKERINTEVNTNPQEVYNSLRVREQHKFLTDNISDLKDEDLISELESRGYNMEKVRNEKTKK